MHDLRAGGLIVGAGIIGSAVACELSRRGVSNLHVIDPDLEGSLSSTERNAGGVRHLWQQAINAELSRSSISFFESIRNEVGFQQSGYLWLFRPEKKAHGKTLLSEAKIRGLEYGELSTAEIRNRYPFIDKTDDLAFGVFGPKDGLLNSNALKAYFRNEAKKHGTIFHDARALSDLKALANGCEATVASFATQDAAQTFLKSPAQCPDPTENWTADFVVLCGGAWMAPMLQRITGQPLVKPVRRQISLFKAEGFDMTPYGMVVDTSQVYFHPEGGNILSGVVLSEESPGFKFDLDADFFEARIWPALYERSSSMERLKPITGWGGLYSYTPDTTGILGKLPGFAHVIEAHSFTGRGVMQSYGVALAVSELLLDGGFRTIDARCLARDRFMTSDTSRWLHEGLHI